VGKMALAIGKFDGAHSSYPPWFIEKSIA